MENFINCLKEGNYKRWESFVKKEGETDKRRLIDSLQQINDILNEKIEKENSEILKEVEKIRGELLKVKEEARILK